MTPATEAAIREHAEAEYPRECCGVVAIIAGRERYIACRNVAATPGEHFVLSAEDYADAEDRGEIVAIVHSHPDAPAQPSVADRVSCEGTGLPWHIVATDANGSGELVTIEPEGFQAPLVGRPFAHGVLDCYSLIRDWYQQERGVLLPDFERRDGWWNDGHSDLYRTNLAAGGFQFFTDESALQPGDLILMQIKSGNDVPNHAGIYLGDGGAMLHHLAGRLSSRDVYGGYWREVNRGFARHESTRGKLP